MEKLCDLLGIRPGITALIGGGGKTTLMYHLARELREECGAELVAVGLLLGQTREFRAAREADYDAYCIRSFYYLCQVGEAWSEPRPQPYEIRLGFTPGWFALEEALQTNKTQLAGPCPQWTVRETRVLAELQHWVDAGLLS